MTKALWFIGGTIAAIGLLYASMVLPPADSLDYHAEYWTWLAIAACVAAVIGLLAAGLRWAAVGIATGLLLTVAFWAIVVALIIHDGGLD